MVVALIGSLLKENGSQVTMQAQTEAGPISLLVCDYQGGAMRGYVQFDAERLAELGANPSLFALFGKGYLALTFDLPGDQGRYQGIVPLEGDTIAQACEVVFRPIGTAADADQGRRVFESRGVPRRWNSGAASA